MFNVKGSKVNTSNSEKLFGEVIMPTESDSLTASYRSNDWRDSLRLTFFDLYGIVETPFFPGMRVDGIQHKTKNP